jgi:hypothetical protein
VIGVLLDLLQDLLQLFGRRHMLGVRCPAGGEQSRQEH